MRVAIFGSGFGLYGYLPALSAQQELQIVLPERYRTKLSSRRDVCHLVDSVNWVEDEARALACVDALVVSQRPSDQVHWVQEVLERENIRLLLLEKPLAPDPTAAGVLLDRIERSGKKLCVGYIFRHLPWGRSLVERRARDELASRIDFRWLFRAHHYAEDLDNWKRHVSVGGGALRFYGTHLIALLAELGYQSVQSSVTRGARPDEAESWTATFSGSGLPDATVAVDSNSSTKQFSVQTGADTVQLSDPFAELPSAGALDRRVQVLRDLCRDFFGKAISQPDWYRASIGLWSGVERITRHEDN